MSKYEGTDHYLDPETGVLKNQLGIEDEDNIHPSTVSRLLQHSDSK